MKNKEMKKDDISVSIIDKIEKEEITPIPRWQFMLREILFGSLVCVGIITGIIGLTMSFIYWSRLDFDVLGTQGNLLESISFFLPILWIGLIIISVILGYYSFKNTERGYKFRIGFALIVFGLIVISSSLFNFVMDRYTGFSKIIMGNKILRDFGDPRYKMWGRPEMGFIAGEVKSYENNGDVMIIDFNGKPWKVDISDANVRPRVRITIGEGLKFLGKVIKDGLFKASDVRPWAPAPYNQGCMQDPNCTMYRIVR